MRTRNTSLLALLFGALTLTACGDGSVRSPGVIGSGELLDARIQCRAPEESEFSNCAGTRNLTAGQAIDYRVVGDFEDGSRQIVTQRFDFSVSDTTRARVEGNTTGGVQRIRARAATEGDPVVVFADDSQGEVDTLSSQLSIEGGVPQNVAVTNMQGGEVGAVFSGNPTQLFARITFNAGEPPQVIVPNDDDPRAPGNIAWEITVDPESLSDLEDNGILIGRNPNAPTAEDPEIELTVRVTVTPREDGPDFNPVQATANITVEPAQFIPGTFRIQFTEGGNTVPLDIQRRLQALANFEGVANDEGETEIRTFDVTDDLDDPGFELTNDEVGEIIPGDGQSDDPRVPNTFRALAVGETDITASFNSGEASDTITATVVEADIGELRLLPVTGNDAVLLGLTEDGRLPCVVDPENPDLCPDDSWPEEEGFGALAQNRTMPGAAIAYRVFGVLEGREDLDPEELEIGQDIFPLGTEINCGSTIILPINVTVDDSGAIAREVITTASGAVAYSVEGLDDEAGAGTLTARLGAGPGQPNGINCATRPVADAEQSIEVGFPDEEVETASLRLKNDNPVRSVTLETSTASACVGYSDARGALTDVERDGRAGKMLRAVAAYEDASGSVLRIPVNQQKRVDFSAQYGTRDDEGRMCDGPLTAEAFPTDEIPDEAAAFFEANSPVMVSNDRNVLRGIMQSRNPVSIGTACVRTNFDLEGVTIDSAAQESQSLSATITALPIVNDNVISGESLLTGEEINGFCDALLPLFDLLPGADENLVIDLLNVLGASGGLLLNSDEANEIGDEGGTELLGALGMLTEEILDPLGLTSVLNSVFSLLGIGGSDDSLAGGALLVTLLDGISTAIQEGAGELPDDFSFEDLLEELEGAAP